MTRHTRSLFVLAIATLVVVAPRFSHAADVARGSVFHDVDRNGSRDDSEPGIEGVRVSNGREVVRTDAEGNYEIAAPDPSILFITKPSGFATPVTKDMLPLFYYVHQPAGSPKGLRYRGLDPTGPLPDRIDFPLIERPEPTKFEAILFADPQPMTNSEIDYIRDEVVAELIGTKAAFGMTMGDILFDDLSHFPRFNAVIGQIGIPWYNVPGNHELNLEAKDDAGSLETFKRFYGPPYYAFEYGDAVFVVLDNIEYLGRDTAAAEDPRGTGKYVAQISEDQLTWLRTELTHIPKDKLVFLAMHAPLESYEGEPNAPDTNTQNRRALFALLEGRPNLYAVAGHTHTTEHHYFGKDDGFAGPGELHHHVLATVSGSWWTGPIDERGIPTTPQRDGTPNGYHTLEVDGADASVRFKAAGKPADEQMRILFDVAHHGLRSDGRRDLREGATFDGRFSVDEVPAAHILVNLYDGGPRSKVEFSVGKRPFKELTRVERIDPWLLELWSRHRDEKKFWIEALPSSHLFEADVPDDLQPGTYTVTVRATDEFGRVHHAHRVLEIQGSSAS